MYLNHKRIILEDGDGKQAAVFAVVASVTADEMIRAEQLGYKAKAKCTMLQAEYSDQQFIIIDDVKYAVYRIYIPDGEKVELYVEEKLGVC